MHVRITREPLDVGGLLAHVSHSEHGAAVLFVGMVRNHNDGRPVSRLRYDAYVPMAEEVLGAITGEALERLRGTGLAEVEAEQRVDGSGADGARVQEQTVQETPAPAAGRIAVEHRIGELAVGEASVAIAVASPHRADAFDACRYVIEQIKRRVPLWKQEQYVEGGKRWLDGHAPRRESATAGTPGAGTSSIRERAHE